MDVGEVIDGAAFDAHFAAVEALKESLNINNPSSIQVAEVLAAAYGDVLAICVKQGATNQDLAIIAERVRVSQLRMLSKLHEVECAGRA